MSNPNENCILPNWLIPFLFKGVVIPLAVPCIIYQLVNKWIRQKETKKFSLKDEVVLITGASSGLGKALAHAFYNYGCKIILASRRMEELSKVKSELMKKSKDESLHEPKIVLLDLADMKRIEKAAQEAIGIHGRIDILINNGGISYRGRIIETDISVDQQVMMVNYFGQVALTKAILPQMIANNHGKILTISSVQGKIAIPFRSAYAASKHALQAFNDSLRAELADTKIGVCVVSPGYINTNLSWNAVQGDGSNYGVQDHATATGMSAREAAEAILVCAVNHDDEVLLAPLIPRLVMLVRVLWPSIYFYIMKRRAKLNMGMKSSN